jgi:O-antigen/teichoic acid export membrane protein
VWTLTGNTVQLGAQWASVMVLAKLGSPILVGEFSLALGLCAPVIALCSLGLRNLLVTDARRSHAYADMLGVRVVGVGVGMITIAAIAAWAARSPRLFAIYLVVAAARSIDSLSDIYWGQLQRAERMDLIAASQILRGLLGICGLCAALALTGSLAWGAAALLATSLLVWWVVDRRAVRYATPDEARAPRFDPVTMRAILAMSSPLILSLLLTSVAGPMPRYFLDAYGSARDVGFFAVASAPIAIAGFLPAAIYQTTAARAARHMQSGEHDRFMELSRKVLLANLAVSGAFYLGSVFFGDVFLRRMFTPEYVRVWPEMNLFCLAQLLTSFAALGSQVTNAARMFRLLAVNAVVSVAALVVASFVLVPRMGVRGSAWADIVYKGSSTLFLMVVGFWWAWTRTRPRGSPVA